MAVVAETDRAVVELAGVDRTSYLEAVTSQTFADAKPGTVRSALHLDVHGGPLLAFDVAIHPERLWLVTPTREVADDVVTVLGGRTFLSDASFRLRDDLAVAALRGQDGQALADSAGLETAPGTWEADGGIVRIGWPGGLDLVGDASDLAEIADRLVGAGARRGDADDLADERIRLGEPEWGREIVAPHLPEELGLLPTHVHLAKGCYPGQEAVARMWQLGRPRRRLALLAPSGTVNAGDEFGGGRRRVTVTSVTRAGDRALGFVPGDADAGYRLAGDDGSEVEVVALLGADEPVPGHDPAVRRRRDQRAS